MKTPRITDFDPKAKEPSLHSSMDDFPAIQKPPAPSFNESHGNSATDHSSSEPVKESISRNTLTLDTRTPRPVLPVHPVPPLKRKMKQRHPFDIYEDQFEELKKLSLEDRMRGGMGSMSAMVREALDAYFAKKRTK
jgi:hypothetical protein